MAVSRLVKTHVLVVGGGPAGAIAARALADAGVSVILVERSTYDDFCVGETLPPHANLLLARVGLTGLLADSGHLASPGIVAVWGSDEAHENDFIFSPYGHGWHLDRRRFNESLAECAVAAGAYLISGAQAVSCERRCRYGWNVSCSTLDSTIAVNAEWVLDATGRASWLTQVQGIPKVRYDRLTALVRIIDDPEQHDARTFIEAMRDGWWYVAALPGRRAIAAFFTDSDLHNFRRSAVESLWNRCLDTSRLVRQRLSTTQGLTIARVIGCPTTKAVRVAGDGWLAVGDAACTIDPLSSEGICWAMGSGLDAANAVLAEDTAAASASYQSEWDDRFRDYLVKRQRYYTTGDRWPDARFWQRRSVGATTQLFDADGLGR